MLFMSIVNIRAPKSNSELKAGAAPLQASAMRPAAPIVSSFGSDLTAADYQRLAARWITPELADDAGLRRVDSLTGREMFGRKTGDLAGIIIPYVLPGENRPVEYRLRVDTPELEEHGCVQAGTVRNGNPAERTSFGESKNSKRD